MLGPINFTPKLLDAIRTAVYDDKAPRAAVPTTMPFVHLTNIPQREIFPGFNVRFVHSATMTFAHWIIKAGSRLPEHSHPHEQVVTMLAGEFDLTIEGETQRLGPGWVGIIPSNSKHSGVAVTDCRIVDAFYPIREDYR